MELKGFVDIDTKEYVNTIKLTAYVHIEGQLLNIVEIFSSEIENDFPTHQLLKKLVECIRWKDKLMDADFTSSMDEILEYEKEKRDKEVAEIYKYIYAAIPKLIRKAYIEKDYLSPELFVELMFLAKNWNLYAHGEF